MNFNFKTFLEFYTLSEKLKTEIRHSYTSDPSRKESVAEHVWMVSLLAIYLYKYIKEDIDLLKVLKMIVIHDLAEALIGDIPVFEKSKRKDEKFENELKAIKQILAKVQDKKLADELLELWLEFEHRETYESKFAKAMDKIDDALQHYTSDISTWEKGDFDTLLGGFDKHFTFDEFLNNLIAEVNEMIIAKASKASLKDRLFDNRTQ